MDLRLEVIVLPVSDVDRAKDFYEAVGFRLDVDNTFSDDYRLVRLAPPGSQTAPGTVQGSSLIVPDIEWRARGSPAAASR